MDRIDLLKDAYTVLHYYKASSLMLLHDNDIKNSTKTWGFIYFKHIQLTQELRLKSKML